MMQARQYPDEVDYVYEYDEKGRRVLVRSLEANQPAYIRFNNKTSRPVDVWWRDYRGAKRFYTKIDPGRHYDVNTFISHPWEFTDTDTKEHFAICNKMFFRPPGNIGGMNFRTNWNITVCVRTLRQTALLALGVHYASRPQVVKHLGLPYILAEELRELTIVLRHVPPLPQE